MNIGRHPVPLFMLALLGAVSISFADVRSNPYTGIVDRNPFGLKPPPPPVVETNAEPAAPPPNVKLTGISNLFAKRALLEVTEQQAPARPGQPPQASGTVNRPILSEGEAAFGIEVIAIDLDRNIVKIRNAGSESELTFEVPKPSGTGAPTGSPAPVGRAASVPIPAPAMAQPTIVSSAESRGGVTMLGGGGGFAGNTGGVSTYGATATPTGFTPGGVSSYGGPSYGGISASAGGLPTIPSRQMRTPQGSQQAQQMDPETQMILMEANRIRNEQMNASGGLRGRVPLPPLPPTRLSSELGGGGPPVPGP